MGSTLSIFEREKILTEHNVGYLLNYDNETIRYLINDVLCPVCVGLNETVQLLHILRLIREGCHNGTCSKCKLSSFLGYKPGYKRSI